jgi:hypothetical protein
LCAGETTAIVFASSGGADGRADAILADEGASDLLSFACTIGGCRTETGGRPSEAASGVVVFFATRGRI